MINYNIFKKIIDRVAINRWINKVKKINKEYKKIYNYDDYFNILYGIKCICIKKSEERRKKITMLGRYLVYVGEVIICIKCGYLHKSTRTIIINKKYHYTSGMDHPKGYKKNEK